MVGAKIASGRYKSVDDVIGEALRRLDAHAPDTAAPSRQELEQLVDERTRALTEAARELTSEMRRRQEMQGIVLQAQKLEALGQLTSSVAHDFANILMAISGSYTLIRRRANSPAIDAIVDQGEFAAGRAHRLISQLMGFVRRERIAPRVLMLPSMIAEARDLIQHAAGSGVMLLLDVADDAYPVVADPYQLEVALLNLASNARDAMDGEGALTIEIRNLAANEAPPNLQPGDYVGIAVKDTGPGMPAEVMARATEMFFTTKSHGKGTGIGLAMVHGFAARLGGCVRIGSTPGNGTTVELVLPRAPFAEATAEPPGSPPIDPQLHGDATILLCDDDEPLRRVTATFLRDLGYTVLDASSAETAAALAATLDNLDLLLTDVQVPGANGMALADRLRRKWPGLPVQFITGSQPRQSFAGQFVLIKPLAFGTLSRAILERLGRQAPPGSGGDRLLRHMQSSALRDLYLGWQTARLDGKVLPRLSDIDPARYGAGPHAYVVQIANADPLSFRFVEVGDALNQRFGRKLDGQPIGTGEDEAEIMGDLQASYRRCTRSLSPVYQAARFDFGDGAPLQLERLILPISDDGRTITHLLGVSLFTEPSPPPSIEDPAGAVQ